MPPCKSQRISSSLSDISNQPLLTPVSVKQTVQGSVVCRQLTFTPDNDVLLPPAITSESNKPQQLTRQPLYHVDQSWQQSEQCDDSCHLSMTPSTLTVRLAKPCCGCRNTVLRQNLQIRSLRRQVLYL